MEKIEFWQSNSTGLLKLAHAKQSLQATVHNENSIQRFPVKRHIVTSRSPLTQPPVPFRMSLISMALVTDGICGIHRLIGTVRRECLDFLIPLNERHLRGLLKEWVCHYNQGRPHSSLGPGIPDAPRKMVQKRTARHFLPGEHRVVAKAVLGGLHHEYSLEKAAA
jgi:hypothetical protein